MDSILNSIKKLLGIEADYTAFDTDLVIHINSVFTILYQLGVGSDPSTPFHITDASSKWSDFIDDGKVELVKSYMYMKVKLMFDPPQNSALLTAMKEAITEFEWRGVVSTGV